MADCSEVWIWVETEVTPSKLVVVEELIDATILHTADAEQITGKANQEYSTYLWQPVPCRGPGEFVVRGQLRSNKSQ
jgi:hypothetical protein